MERKEGLMTAPSTNIRLVDTSQPTKTQSVSAILKRCSTSLVADWLTLAKQCAELNHLHLSDEERTGHLPKLVEDLIVRLNKSERAPGDSHAIASPAAIAHGELRHKQGYSSAMLIDESR